ncbi:MAG: hypothetical protein COA68_07805 [Oceanobacter sp.]|jgi:hypothetical protein|nr:MAG: hypothetical protein COA68_07805 [Oceanobacter sp.]
MNKQVMTMNKGLMPIIFALFICAATAVQALPQNDETVHEGVASCANSVCHGRATPKAGSEVNLNEYRIWLKNDAHSLAYKVLLNDKSKMIAANLGLPDAHTAKICLDCHADNVEPEYRGEKFQISDGVGCESCHGGSQNWLATHTSKDATHPQNIENGLYPLTNPDAKAELCLSCHQGTKDKLATHEIMGAGHPRLRFDMAVFSANQPRHYDRDADYYFRGKAEITPAKAWLSGLTHSAIKSLDLIQDHFDRGKVFPELALFDCHSCHHGMNEKRWNTNSVLLPGSVRLNLSQVRLLADVIEPLNLISKGELASLRKTLNAVNKGSQSSVVQTQKSAKELTVQLQAVKAAMADKKLDGAAWDGIRANILKQAGRGAYSDFIMAEQIFLALDTLNLAINSDRKYQRELDAIFMTVKDESHFVPSEFKRKSQQFYQALGK